MRARRFPTRLNAHPFTFYPSLNQKKNYMPAYALLRMASRMPAFVVAPRRAIDLACANSFSAASVHFWLGEPDGVALRELDFDFDFERERFARLPAFGDGFGFVGEGERARVRAGERDGVAVFLGVAAFLGEAVFFGVAAFFGDGLRAAEPAREVLRDFARGAAGERAADLRADGEREEAREDGLADAAGATADGDSAPASFSGVVGFAPTDLSSSARSFGERAGDFFALDARDGDVRSAATTALVMLSLM